MLCCLVIQSGSDAAAAETSSGSVRSDDVSRLETELDYIEQVVVASHVLSYH